MSPSVYNPSPIYLQIRGVLLRWLSTLQIGERLPVEEDLSRRFGVSRVTIRRAIQSLEEQGIIERRAGYGTWLAAPVPRPADDRLTGPIEDFDGLGLQTRTELLSRTTIKADRTIAEILEIPKGTKVYFIQRRRLIADNPLLVLYAYMPLALKDKVRGREIGVGLLTPVLREQYDPDLREQVQKVEAINAPDKLAKPLEVEPGAAVLCVNRVFVDAEGKPAVYFRTFFRSDKYFYTVDPPTPRLARTALGKT